MTRRRDFRHGHPMGFRGRLLVAMAIATMMMMVGSGGKGCTVVRATKSSGNSLSASRQQRPHHHHQKDRFRPQSPWLLGRRTEARGGSSSPPAQQQQPQAQSGPVPTGTIPQSSNRYRGSSSSSSSLSYPPWNPSTQIGADGFLLQCYDRVPGEWESEIRLRSRYARLTTPCAVRQVPGDGNCLFHAVSLGLRFAVNATHWDLRRQLSPLYHHSRWLRHQAVACLRQEDRRLHLQGREHIRAHELVEAAAQQYGLTPAQYCRAMEQDSVWGGGPEIVALSNWLERPIHVYELCAQQQQQQQTAHTNRRFAKQYHRNAPSAAGKQGKTTSFSKSSSSSSSLPKVFVLRRMACFGSPRFDHKAALHILSADSRFPDLRPGHQQESGNHFLAVFPLQPPPPPPPTTNQATPRRPRRPRRGRFRGGGARDDDTDVDTDEDDDDDDDEELVWATLVFENDATVEHSSFWGWWRYLLPR